MLVLIRNITALNVIPYLSQYRFALDLALSGCVAHTIKSWDFPYTSKTHFPLLGTQYINNVWLCALASRAPGCLGFLPGRMGGLMGATGPESVMQTSDLIVDDLAVSRTSNQGDRGMVEVAVIVAAVPALAIAAPPAVLLNDVGSFNNAGGIIPDCVELNVGSGVFCVAHGVDLVDGINLPQPQSYRLQDFTLLCRF